MRHTGEDAVDWMVEHLDTTERLVMDRATWAVLDTFGRQYRQQRFGISRPGRASKGAPNPGTVVETPRSRVAPTSGAAISPWK